MSETKPTKKTFYHATSMQALQAMMKDGVMRSSEETGVISNGHQAGVPAESRAIYLSDNKDDIGHLYENAVKNTTFEPNLPNSGVLLEIEVDTAHLLPDRNDPQAYPAFQQDHDKGQVAHMGNIDVSQIKSVTFQYPVTHGGYVTGLGGMGAGMAGMQLSREFGKGLAIGRELSLDESIAVIDKSNHFIESQFKEPYQTKVAAERIHCEDHKLERLRLVQSHAGSADALGNTKHMLSITRVNDLDLLTPGAFHNENPMLVDNGPGTNSQYYRSYSSADFEAIQAVADKDGVFLAQIERTPGGQGASKYVVDASSVEPSSVRYNHAKHVAYTNSAREEGRVKKEVQHETDAGLTV